MRWKNSTSQYHEIANEICAYCNAGGFSDVSAVFRRNGDGTYSDRYLKSRIRSSLTSASKEIEGSRQPASTILRDLYEYKYYKMRNKNENKIENKTTR